MAFDFEFNGDVEKFPMVGYVIGSFVELDGHNYCFKCNPKKKRVFDSGSVHYKDQCLDDLRPKKCKKCSTQLTTMVPKSVKSIC